MRLEFTSTHHAPHRLKRCRLHTSARALQQQLPVSVFDGLFKFAFAGNPWDLLTSYHHAITPSLNHPLCEAPNARSTGGLTVVFGRDYPGD